MANIPFYENTKFVAIIIIVAVALAIFAMFSTTNVGVAFLKTAANGVMP